ncbi:hypothetical protein NQ317_012422 [Molorchus minor]|uniref:MADF domain-containing protein n=1 Tax=Molorchus minor TaxID=1323400 RepID=A0ABQ9JAE1_9CUCU|nr:hypothetical protein NQ317_012422 [Molorchus minor]
MHVVILHTNSSSEYNCCVSEWTVKSLYRLFMKIDVYGIWKNKQYHNRDISRKTWEKISKEMNANITAIKGRWRGLWIHSERS